MKKIHISSYHAASNARIEKKFGAHSNLLNTSATPDEDWVRILPFIELTFRSSLVKGLGISPYEIHHSGYSMVLPIDMMMLQKFDEEHHSPPEYIVKIKNNINQLNYITLQNKKENQLVIKKLITKK